MHWSCVSHRYQSGAEFIRKDKNCIGFEVCPFKYSREIRAQRLLKASNPAMKKYQQTFSQQLRQEKKNSISHNCFGK
jgi:hypothetical protein